MLPNNSSISSKKRKPDPWNDYHNRYFQSHLLHCTHHKLSPQDPFFSLIDLSWNLLCKIFHLQYSLHLMLHCRKSSEQFQTVLNLCEMLICGSVYPRERKASSSFSRTSFQTEPPQCLFTILFKHSSAKHQSAMQRNLPSQALVQPSSRGQALSHRERWQLLSPT